MPATNLATAEFARRVRVHALRMVHHAKSSHIGTCLSMTDILAVLYNEYLRVDPANPSDTSRDRLVLSKGHGAAALYATLAERGFFPTAELMTYCDNGSRLAGHISHFGVPGVEVSTGSLGHGLSIGCGLAMGARALGRPARVVTILSDGECDEGSIWEAILFAPHHRLSNLTAVVDHNKIQSFGTVKEVLDLAPFAEKWRACNWHVQEIDGHDFDAIRTALANADAESAAPSVIIAHTVKGKGVSFMENTLAWHYRSPDDKLLAQAIAEVTGGQP